MLSGPSPDNRLRQDDSYNKVLLFRSPHYRTVAWALPLFCASGTHSLPRVAPLCDEDGAFFNLDRSVQSQDEDSDTTFGCERLNHRSRHAKMV